MDNALQGLYSTLDSTSFSEKPLLLVHLLGHALAHVLEADISVHVLQLLLILDHLPEIDGCRGFNTVRVHSSQGHAFAGHGWEQNSQGIHLLDMVGSRVLRGMNLLYTVENKVLKGMYLLDMIGSRVLRGMYFMEVRETTCLDQALIDMHSVVRSTHVLTLCRVSRVLELDRYNRLFLSYTPYMGF